MNFMKKMMKNDFFWIIPILIIMIFNFDYVNHYCNGSYELKWMYEGMTVSSHDLRLLLLFGLNGWCIFWLIQKYAKRAKIAVMILSVTFSSVLMTFNEISMHAIPLMTFSIWILIKVRSTRQKALD